LVSLTGERLLDSGSIQSSSTLPTRLSDADHPSQPCGSVRGRDGRVDHEAQVWMIRRRKAMLFQVEIADDRVAEQALP
jgi:hypothetical protein